MRLQYSGGYAHTKITPAIARRRSATSDKMIRTIIYILPRQYVRYQFNATKMQRHFVELVRAKFAELLGMPDLRRYLREPDIQHLLERTENTVSIQIYIPAATKRRIERIRKSYGVTQSGLFRVALNLK